METRQSCWLLLAGLLVSLPVTTIAASAAQTAVPAEGTDSLELTLVPADTACAPPEECVPVPEVKTNGDSVILISRPGEEYHFKVSSTARRTVYVGVVVFSADNPAGQAVWSHPVRPGESYTFPETLLMNRRPGLDLFALMAGPNLFTPNDLPPVTTTQALDKRRWDIEEITGRLSSNEQGARVVRVFYHETRSDD